MRRRKCVNSVLLVFVSLLILMLLASPVYGQYQFNFLPHHWRPSHIGLDYDHLSSAWRNIVYNSRMTWNNAGAGVYLTYDANSWCDVWADYYGTAYPWTNVLGYTDPVRTTGSWYEEVDVYINLSYHPGFDGQTVVTHELGHFVGLAHQNAYPSVMVTPYSGVRRNLYDYDIRATYALYPAVYRLYNGVDHFYTQSAAERDTLISWGWSYEGVRFYAWGGNVADTLPFYRLYNGVDHFYTASAAERDMLISWGWSYEGIATYVLTYAADDIRPLYRLYNGIDHFYTIDASERDYAISVGYAWEGTAAYVRYR